MKIYRQGDVLLKEIGRLPFGLKKAQDNILALGEATGHNHKLVSEQICVFEDKQKNKFVNLEQDTELIHEEHGKIVLDAALYMMVKEREFSPFDEEIKAVMD